MELIIGVILPALIGLLNRKTTDSDARFWGSVAIVAVVAGLVNAVENNFSYPGMTAQEIIYSIGGSFTVLFTATKISYEGFWNNKDVSKMVSDKVLDNESPLKALGLKPNEK